MKGHDEISGDSNVYLMFAFKYCQTRTTRISATEERNHSIFPHYFHRFILHNLIVNATRIINLKLSRRSVDGFYGAKQNKTIYITKTEVLYENETLVCSIQLY